MHERRDPEPRLRPQPPLLGPQPGRALDRIHRARAVHAGEVPEAVLGRLLVPAGRGHLALHGRDDLAALVDPVADDLRELLLEGHARVQLAHALRDLGELHGAGRRGLRPGHPFTAPVRPPTMRRSKIEKKMSAGIIDSDVNASTLAVSTEYCDENDCTPSGSV